MQMFARYRIAIRLAAVLAGPAGRAKATTQGALAVTVEDPTQAVVANAVVTIRNNGTNATQTLKADASGYAKAPLLEPGVYTVHIEAPGFGAYTADRVVIDVGQLTTLEPKLTTGAAETTVQVSAAGRRWRSPPPRLWPIPAASA